MCLIIIHLGEGREKLLEMLCSGRVAMRGLSPVYESHPEAVFFLLLPDAAVGLRRSGVEVIQRAAL